MRKALRIIALSAGIISIVSTVVLACMYLEDLFGLLKTIKSKVAGRIASHRSALETDYDLE